MIASTYTQCIYFYVYIYLYTYSIFILCFLIVASYFSVLSVQYFFFSLFTLLVSDFIFSYYIFCLILEILHYFSSFSDYYRNFNKLKSRFNHYFDLYPQ